MADPNFSEPKGHWGGEEHKPVKGDPLVRHGTGKVDGEGKTHVKCGEEYSVTATVTQGEAECANFNYQPLYDLADRLLTVAFSKIVCDDSTDGFACTSSGPFDTYRSWSCADGTASLQVSRTLYCKTMDTTGLPPPDFTKQSPEGHSPWGAGQIAGKPDLGPKLLRCPDKFRLVEEYTQETAGCNKDQISQGVDHAKNDAIALAEALITCGAGCYRKITTPWFGWECIANRNTIRVTVVAVVECIKREQ